MWGLGPISVQDSYRSIHKISSNLNCLAGKLVLCAKILTLWLPFDVLWGGSMDLLNQLACLIYTALGNERWQNWHLISHFTIHSPYFIVLSKCSIVSHLLLAILSLPLHCRVSMFTQALLHILTWVSYCSLEDSIWCSWFSQQSISVVVFSIFQKPLLRVQIWIFWGWSMSNLHQQFSILFLLVLANKCYLLLTPFPSEKPLCLDSPPNYVGSFISDSQGNVQRHAAK